MHKTKRNFITNKSNHIRRTVNTPIHLPKYIILNASPGSGSLMGIRSTVLLRGRIGSGVKSRSDGHGHGHGVDLNRCARFV